MHKVSSFQAEVGQAPTSMCASGVTAFVIVADKSQKPLQGTLVTHVVNTAIPRSRSVSSMF